MVQASSFGGLMQPQGEGIFRCLSCNLGAHSTKEHHLLIENNYIRSAELQYE